MSHAGATAKGVVMVDVAKRAGVSQKTVSRVVNNAPHVRPDVRDRVIAAIEELGYHPNVAAQALARNRTHVIGMLTIATSLYGPARRVFTIEQATRRHGFNFALASLPDLDRETVAEGVQNLLGSGVEGIVIEVPNHLVDLDLGRLSLPVVTSAGRVAGVARQAVVDVDQAESARQATNYLLGLGHETVWHLAGPRDWDAARKRLTGWRTALQEVGRPVPRVLYGDWSARAGYQRGLELASRDDVTAVFAANDHMAMGLLRAIAESGRRVPDDISVMGYDNVPEAEFQMVPLSTVGSDETGTAERMLSELVALIEGGAPPEAEIDLGFALIFRRSSGAPPSR